MERAREIIEAVHDFIGYPELKNESINVTMQRIAFIQGAKWADKTIIEKACEYLRNNIDKDLIIYHNNTYKKLDEFIKDFKYNLE